MKYQTVTKNLKILDFDIENRPLSYGGFDYTFPDVTAIAASFVGTDKVHVWLLGENTYEEMLEGFKELYDEADIVTGHYIRRHDLPIINSAMVEFKLPHLGSKLASCTKEDLIPFRGVSKSQESLSAMYELVESKYHMNQTAWRLGNRLLPEGIKYTKKRVIDDVMQHKSLRIALAEQNLLKGAMMWNG